MACVAYSFRARIISLNCREWKGARGRAGERHARGEPGVLLLSFGRTGLVILALCLVIHSQSNRVHRGRGGQRCGKPMEPRLQFSFFALLSFYCENDSGPLTCLPPYFISSSYLPMTNRERNKDRTNIHYCTGFFVIQSCGLLCHWRGL